MSDKPAVFGIPLREAFIVGGMLLSIGIAYADSRTGIKHNREKIVEVKKEMRDKFKELRSDIKENRRLLLRLLQRK